MKTKTTKHQLNARTHYLLDTEGYGTIFTTAGDLDRVADQVAQDIGFPIDYGTWAEPDAAMIRVGDLAHNTMFVAFSIAESALEDWKAGK